MSDRPILFSAPMVRALLDGRKTQTRRVLKPQPTMHDAGNCSIGGHSGPVDYLMRDIYPQYMAPFRKGDRLWVREAWRCNGWASDVATIFYRASEGDGYTAMCEQWPVADHKPLRVDTKWSPSLHMPRWASRLTLIVTDVRVQRLQEIDDDDCVAEGIEQKWTCLNPGTGSYAHANDVRDDFAALWKSINGPDSWKANPWVVVLDFTVERRNIDARAA